MATYNGVRDDLVVCPYNGQHKVKRGRLDIHISKCRKNIARCRLKPCAFNPSHNAPATTEGYQVHLATCPDRSATHLSTATGNDSPYDPVPAPLRAKPFVPEAQERWDVEAGPAVDPCRPTVAPIFRTVQGMTRSERRRHYRSLSANGPPVINIPVEHAQTPTVPTPQTLGKGDCADEEEQYWDEAPELEPVTLRPQPVQAAVQHVYTHGAQTKCSSLWTSQPHYDQAEVSRPRGNQVQMTGHSWTAAQADQAEPCQPSCAPASRPRFDQATQYQTGQTISGLHFTGEAQVNLAWTNQAAHPAQAQANQYQDAQATQSQTGHLWTTRAVQTLERHQQSAQTSSTQGCSALPAPRAIDVHALARKLMGLSPTCQLPDCD